MARLLEATLEELKVIKNGRADVDEADNRVIITIHYPRANEPAISSVRSIKLEDNVAKAFPGKLKKKLIIKENVEGRFAISASVTSEIKASAFEKALGKGIGELLKIAIGKIPAVGTYLTGFSGPIAEFLEADDDIEIIGEGSVDLDDTYVTGDITIDLVVPKDFDRIRTVNPNPPPRYIIEPLNAGDANGHVKLNLT